MITKKYLHITTSFLCSVSITLPSKCPRSLVYSLQHIKTSGTTSIVLYVQDIRFRHNDYIKMDFFTSWICIISFYSPSQPHTFSMAPVLTDFISYGIMYYPAKFGSCVIFCTKLTYFLSYSPHFNLGHVLPIQLQLT